MFGKGRTTLENPNLKLIDNEQVFKTLPFPGGTTPSNRVQLTKLKPKLNPEQTRAQTVNNAFVPNLRIPLRDGRRNGFFNLHLKAPLDRERSSRVAYDESFKKRASVDAYVKMAKSRESARPTRDSMQISDASELRTSRLEKRSLGANNECTSFAQRSVSIDVPIELKIQKLHQKLNDLGVQLPDSQRGIMHNLGKLDTNRSGHSVTDSIMKSVRTNVPSGQFLPPYGGHTKSSLIRQEI